jgi:hypothetical protein
MPGDKNRPIDGKILIKYGKLNAEGTLVGASIAKVKGMMAAQLPEGEPPIPTNIAAKIATMDPEAEAWKQVAAPQEESLVMLSTDWGMQMFQAASKVVPDDYVIRKEDVFLEFFVP